MTVFDPDASLRWLFCMTHPDDEIAICAWIKRLTKAGNQVYMSWTHSTSVRHHEARRAAKILGLKKDHLFFHHATDGKIAEEMRHLLPRFEEMIGFVEPDRIVCGAFEQGHIDHDSTNLMVNLCYSGPVLEVPFYYTYLTRRPVVNRFAVDAGQEILKLSKSEQRFKIFLARAYPSQAIFRNLVFAEIRQRFTRLRPERLRQTERMRVQTHKDFLEPNLPEPLKSHVRRSKMWSRWEAAARRVL